MSTISRDFYELSYSVDSLAPDEVEGEIAPLVTPGTGEPSVLTALAGLHGRSFALNGSDSLIILLEDLEDAVGRAPAEETQASLARLATYSILEAFKQIDSRSTRSEFNIKKLGREAAQFTDHMNDPRMRTIALLSISRALTGTHAAHTTKSTLFWDSTMYLEDAAKEARGEEEPEERARLLSMISRQAGLNVAMAELSGMLSEENLGRRFAEVMNEMSLNLFAEALSLSDDLSLETAQTEPEDLMAKLIASIRPPASEDGPDNIAPFSDTARMAHGIVGRLAGINR